MKHQSSIDKIKERLDDDVRSNPEIDSQLREADRISAALCAVLLVFRIFSQKEGLMEYILTPAKFRHEFFTIMEKQLYHKDSPLADYPDEVPKIMDLLRSVTTALEPFVQDANNSPFDKLRSKK